MHSGLLSDQEFRVIATMATLASFVGRAAGNGLYSSTLCDIRTNGHPKSEPVPSLSPVRMRQTGPIQETCLVPAFYKRSPRLSTVSRNAGAPGDNDEPTNKDSSGVRESKFDGTVEQIQKALGKSFGGPVWFAVLLTLLAAFGGGYVYLIIKFADFSDIPILNGPQGL